MHERAKVLGGELHVEPVIPTELRLFFVLTLRKGGFLMASEHDIIVVDDHPLFRRGVIQLLKWIRPLTLSLKPAISKQQW